MKPFHPSRRQLLALAASFGLAESLAPLLASNASAQAGTRVRENITTFSKDPKKVAALRAAVKRMKERSKANAHDPLGWDYWAAVHSSDQQPPPALKKIYGQCDHSFPGYVARHFVSWHRAYLFFFESVLKQAAKDAGQTIDLELPYWDWYETPKLPTIFVEGSEGTNPLWHRRVRTDITNFKLDRGAFKYGDLLPSPQVPPSQAFSSVLEGNPHGTVHGAIGDDMGSISTSARDPIFWLHHANIDRLWTAWAKPGNRVIPAAGSPWGKTSWNFDVAAQWTQQAANTLDSEAVLKYSYDDESMPKEPSVLVAQATPKAIEGKPLSVDLGKLKGLNPMTAATSKPATISATQGGITLGNDAVQVNLKIAAPLLAPLSTLAQPSGAAVSDIKSGSLVLENVEVGLDGKRGGFSFEIVASLPGDSGGTRSIVIGSLNTFSLSASQHGSGHSGASAKQTLTFPLSEILQGLGATSTNALAQGLRVTFEPSHPPTGQSPSLVKVGAIKINVSTLAVQ